MEEALLLAIHGVSNPVLDALFVISHHLADELFCGLLVLGAAVFYRARGNGREALLWLALGVSTYLIQKLLKIGVERPRPELWTSVVALDSFAFPSGHAIAAATFYPLLARGVAKRFPARAKIAYALAGLMGLYIGLGRLYLGVHWPSDVVAGWAIGVTQLGFALWWMERRAIVPALRGIE